MKSNMLLCSGRLTERESAGHAKKGHTVTLSIYRCGLLFLSVNHRFIESMTAGRVPDQQSGLSSWTHPRIFQKCRRYLHTGTTRKALVPVPMHEYKRYRSSSLCSLPGKIRFIACLPVSRLSKRPCVRGTIALPQTAVKLIFHSDINQKQKLNIVQSKGRFCQPVPQ